MAGIDNLIPNSERSPEELREMAKKGGIASGIARRKKKTMKENLEIILGMPLNNGEEASIEEIQSFAAIKGKNITVEQAMLIAQVQKALKGDTQAMAFLRDTSGQRPVEQVEMNTTINKTADEIEDYINGRKK